MKSPSAAPAVTTLVSRQLSYETAEHFYNSLTSKMAFIPGLCCRATGIVTGNDNRNLVDATLSYS